MVLKVNFIPGMCLAFQREQEADSGLANGLYHAALCASTVKQLPANGVLHQQSLGQGREHGTRRSDGFLNMPYMRVSDTLLIWNRDAL